MKTSRFACLSVLLPLVAGAATISDVSFRQDRATRAVIVNYTLSNDGNPAYVTMEVLDGGLAIASANINIKTATGDISQIDGHAVPDDGETKTITWRPVDDWPGHLMTSASVRITARPAGTPPVQYMYIDLSGGPSATSYPVLTTYDAPDPTDVTCISNKLWMRRVEPGTFTQGSPSSEAGRTSNREAQHQVTLTQPFFAGVFEVTRAQYRLVMGSDPGNGSTPTCPVNNLTLSTLIGQGINPAVSNTVAEGTFFAKIREKTGMFFNLPTDAQWEYACRAGTTTPYNVETNATVTVDDLAWYKANTPSQKVQPVGQKIPNAWGLYDMHGNVFEFCRERLNENLGTGARTDPLYTGEGGSGFTIRGGSILQEATSCRSAQRNWRAASSSDSGYSSWNIQQDGFRLWLTLER
ncbi:MAG: formylglycine-generating enzyme family protein [Kiritimatiellae bacterium]|nr:formylglycine-generating enzyme family protein [Kiritimatiellia bacterium]